ncbi:MAG: ATP-binding protein [Candidatus Poribacteria bacterium]|nr:ATP-binding protein [Candidatus Poribacteria bacterium]
MIFTLPQLIRHDYDSFKTLTNLYSQTKELFFDDIEIDMQAIRWFDADMCAAFGAILYSLGKKLNEINLIHIPPPIAEILSKNGFMSHYGREKIPDRWETTITYQRFDVADDHYFANYIEDELIHRSEISKMSSILLKKFRESIFEIFSNPVSHSRSELGIFSCGQFFPRQDRLNFMVADLGIGIRQNIRNIVDLDLSPEEAIIWATEGNNTTRRRRDNLPGGLGLKILCDFIDLNRGCLQIVSDAGYWERRNGETVTRPLTHPFPGTVVNVEINTADTHVYQFNSEELSPEDIF